MRKFITLLLVLLTTCLSAQETIKKKNGQVSITNGSGIVIERGVVKNHMREGQWTKYYNTGERMEESTYAEGVLNGPFRSYTKEGRLKRTGFYTNGLPTGEWQIYDSQQRLSSVISYDMTGKEIGSDKYEYGRLKERQIEGAGGYRYVQTFNADGSVRTRYTMLNEKPEGVYYEYNTSRTNATGDDTLPLKIAHYHNGNHEGSEMEWQMNDGKRVLRSETWYKNNEKDSIYRSYDANEHIQKESYYKNGKQHGEQITYSDNIVTSKKWYKMGRTDSTYEYYKDGKIKRISTKQYIRKYYPDGKIEEDKTLGQSGTPLGPCITYYPNGKKKHELNYANDRVNGEWKAWNENGVLVIHAWAKRSTDTLEYVYNNKGKKLAETDTAYDAQLRRYRPEMIHPKPKPSSQLKRQPMPVHYGDLGEDGGTWETDGSDEAPPMIIEQKLEERPDVFSFAEEMPTFPGGEAAYQEYLKKNLKYPQVEKDAGKQGTVYLTFTVQADGKIADVKAAKEVTGAPGFTKEAIRVIKAMPNWTPGKMNGRAVAITMTMPVRFKID